MIFKNINKIHLARLDLNVPVCVLVPKVVIIADNSSRFGNVPKDYIYRYILCILQIFLLHMVRLNELQDNNYYR